MLEDAAPLFGCAAAVARAGVLLALPVLGASDVFECAQKIYGNLGHHSLVARGSLLGGLKLGLKNA